MLGDNVWFENRKYRQQKHPEVLRQNLSFPFLSRSLLYSFCICVLKERSRHIDRLTFEVDLEVYKIYTLQICKTTQNRLWYDSCHTSQYALPSIVQ